VALFLQNLPNFYKRAGICRDIAATQVLARSPCGTWTVLQLMVGAWLVACQSAGCAAVPRTLPVAIARHWLLPFHTMVYWDVPLDRIFMPVDIVRRRCYTYTDSITEHSRYFVRAPWPGHATMATLL